MTNPVPVLSDDEVAEVAEMFPHAEYQPTLNADEVDPCHFCKGTIDDHKANCVVPHVHALCATVRALRELAYVPKVLADDDEITYRDQTERLLRQNTALREQLGRQPQPMSTAPTDGSEVRIFHQNTPDDRLAVDTAVYASRKGMWVSPDGGHGYDPIAWMSLTKEQP